MTAASAGAALVGLAADAPAWALLTGIAGLQLAAALLHGLTAAGRPVPQAKAAAAATEPTEGSATTPAGRRTRGGL